jgi:hypothetical protein
MDAASVNAESVSKVVTDGEPVAVEAVPQTLGALSRELRFFTPALIMTHGFFDRDPLYEFNSRHYNPDPDMRPFAADLDLPMFQGLPVTSLWQPAPALPAPVDWNRRIYGIHASRFEELDTFLCGLFIINRGRSEVVAVRSHVLQVVDVTALSQQVCIPDALPQVFITVYCVSTNKRFVYMKPAMHPPITQAYPVIDSPQPALLQQAQAVLGDICG